MIKQHHPDSLLIQALGGATALAKTLGLNKHGTQRVHNWTRRGIPAAVKLSRPDLFLQVTPIGGNVNV